MRFAYIDSNGNEVPIPSVDALALRIELGAITDDTQLYDAQADQWGPATSHEIYHTLVRDAGDEDGFVAPPPVAPPPVAEVVPGGVVAGEEALSMEEIAPDAAEVAADAEVSTPVAETSAPKPESTSEAPDSDDTPASDDFGVSDLAPAAGFEPSGAPTAPTAATGDGSNNTLDLAPQLDDAGPIEETTPIDLDAPDPAAVEDVDVADTGAFNFGSMDGGLELDSGFDEPADAMDFSGGGDQAPMDLAGQTGDFDTGPSEPVPDFTGGMELESTMEFDAGGFGGAGGSLDLETPMSEFSPEDPPSWMDDQDEEEAGTGDVMDFSSVAADPVVAREQAPKRTSRSRPSKPRRPRRSMVGPLVGVVVLVAIGAGGYAAWPMVQDWMESRNQPEQVGPVMPPLDADLMQPMRDRADQAFASILAEVRSERVVEGAPSSPPADWLAGIYLAQASDYESAALFWDQMSEVLAGLRAVDVAAFDEAFAATGEAGVDPADFAAMRERADSGFVAAAESRNAALDEAQALIDGASRLHQFLVANEANIEYAPASVVTTDPVLEVNPATEEIRTAMQNLIGEVVDGLAAIDYRERPSADGLWATILARWQAAGIQ